MLVRKIRDTFVVEINLEMVDRISTGNEELHPIGGKGLNKGADTEMLQICSGTEINYWRVIRRRDQKGQIMEDFESLAEKCVFNFDGNVNYHRYLNVETV